MLTPHPFLALHHLRRCVSSLNNPSIIHCSRRLVGSLSFRTTRRFDGPLNSTIILLTSTPNLRRHRLSRLSCARISISRNRCTNTSNKTSLRHTTLTHPKHKHSNSNLRLRPRYSTSRLPT
jgi:hypothetical protein